MTCPRCNGYVKQVDRATLDPHKHLRKKRCMNCHYEFFTKEVIVENDLDFKREWISCHRSYQYMRDKEKNNEMS